MVNFIYILVLPPLCLSHSIQYSKFGVALELYVENQVTTSENINECGPEISAVSNSKELYQEKMHYG